jgi:NTE family protein
MASSATMWAQPSAPPPPSASAIASTSSRFRLWRQILVSNTIRHSWRRGAGWAAIDPTTLLLRYLPDGVPELIEDLETPMRIVMSDLAANKSVVARSGDLMTALAGSIAVPGMMSPVVIDGRTMIDGAVLDPVPVRHAMEFGVPVVAIDIGCEPGQGLAGLRNPHFSQIARESVRMMTRTVTRLRLRECPPELMLRPHLGAFGPRSFHRTREFFDHLAPFKNEVKHAIDGLLTRASDDAAGLD